jgi:acyl-coenzyme A thioesterase PaaI-like protein
MSPKEPLSNIKEFADQLKEILPELKSYVENPKRLGTWLEEHNPWLSRQLLGAVSNLSDPYLAGMGLTVDLLTETRAEVTLPDRWKNKAEGGVAHVGALTTAAEFASRIYWERLLNLQRNSMRVTNLSAKFFVDARSTTKAVFDIPENEREALMFKLRSEGEVKPSCAVKIYDHDGRLVAEVTVDWHFHQAKALGSGLASGQAEKN